MENYILPIEALREILEEAHNSGYEPTIIINGEHYQIDFIKQ